MHAMVDFILYLILYRAYGKVVFHHFEGIYYFNGNLNELKNKLLFRVQKKIIILVFYIFNAKIPITNNTTMFIHCLGL